MGLLRGWRPLALVVIVGVATGFGVIELRRTEDPRAVFERAVTAFEAGDQASAEAGLQRVNRLRSPTPLDWGLRARLEMAGNRTDRALDALGRIPDGHALGPWARLTAGQLEVRRHRMPAAEQALRHALRLDPGLVQARRELIYVLAMQLRRGELDREFEALSRRAELTYREVWIWCMVPDLIWWRPEESLETLEPCLEAEPSDRWTRLAVAENHRRLARYDKAMRVLEPMSAEDPDALAMRARLLLEEGEAEAASRVLAGAPGTHGGVARLRGQFAMGRGDAIEAIRQFEIARRAEPDRRETASNLSRALLVAGQVEEAKSHLAAVGAYDRLATLLLRAEAEAGARDRELLLQLGEACRDVGRMPEARAWLTLAIRLDPLDREAQEALFRLGEPGAGL